MTIRSGQSKTAWPRRAALVAVLAGALGAMAVPAVAGERDAVLAANARFYAALNQMFKGELAAMKTVWSHAADVTYVGPTGNFEHGWAAVLKDWQGQAAMKLGGKVEPTGIRVTLGRPMAVVSDYEMGENTNAQGNIERVKLRATNVYRKEGGRWKMVGHHTDLLPYLAK
jgi:ketosteroid isomerase-like protein